MVNVAAAFTAMEIEEAVSGQLLWGRPEMVASGVSTDTRSIEAGALFVPLVGPNFDGHDFLGDALAAGAVGALIERGRSLSPADGVFAVEVVDTLHALGELARYHRARFDLPVVAVTGSNGKEVRRESQQPDRASAPGLPTR